MKKILITFGTRPEAIKMAPVVKALKRVRDFNVRICVTAQHRQMLDQVLDLFNLKPDFDLDLMSGGQNLTDITTTVLKGMKSVMHEWKPDLMLVQGDTTTTFAASLAAFYEKVTVGHVEAGLRTGNINAPWPEEMNRCLTTAIVSIHFAPTDNARKNLHREGVSDHAVHVTGNTVIDALLEVTARIRMDGPMKTSLNKQFFFLDDKRKLILVTGHRRENFGDGFERICRALKRLSVGEEVELIYPVHLNPNVQEPVRRILGHCPNIYLTEPLYYLPFVYLMERSYMIITDSGGVQEEAPSLGKPVLVLRETTERPEAVDAGTAKLVGTDENLIVQEAHRLLKNTSVYETMSQAHNPYGDGQASKRIAKACKQFLSCGGRTK